MTATREEKVQDLMKSFRSLKRHGVFRHTAFATKSHITPAQWSVLMLLEDEAGMTVKDIARALGTTSSAATQLIDGLSESGYVLRDINAKDRRAVSLILSKKTAAQVSRWKKQFMTQFLALFEALNDTEFDQYLRLNRKIVQRFNEK